MKWYFSFLFFLSACGENKTHHKLLIAESLWQKKQYPAAVIEYEKIYQEDPVKKLGRIALYRAALTEAFFLNKQDTAIKKFEQLSRTPTEHAIKMAALHHLGELLFTTKEDYAKALLVYENLLNNAGMLQDFYQYRIARCYFFLNYFQQSVLALKKVIAWEQKKSLIGYPVEKLEDFELFVPYVKEDWSKKARYDLGYTYFVAAEQKKNLQESKKLCTVKRICFEEALYFFENFIEKYKEEKELLPLAQFYLANVLEEKGEDQKALPLYQQLKGNPFISSYVLDAKLSHLTERKREKNR